MTKRLCFINMLAAACLIGLPAGAGEPIAETPASPRPSRVVARRPVRHVHPLGTGQPQGDGD